MWAIAARARAGHAAKNTLLRWFAFLPLKEFGRVDEISKRAHVADRRQIQFSLDTSAYIGKEFNEVLLVLRFELKYKDTGVPGYIHHIMYYPFGVMGRENLRKMLSEGFD